MTRRYSANETARNYKARRTTALARNELRGPSEPRVSADGATAMAIKVNEMADEIEEFLAKRRSA